MTEHCNELICSVEGCTTGDDNVERVPLAVETEWHDWICGLALCEAHRVMLKSGYSSIEMADGTRGRIRGKLETRHCDGVGIAEEHNPAGRLD